MIGGAFLWLLLETPAEGVGRRGARYREEVGGIRPRDK
jgi:hypothetical protein